MLNTILLVLILISSLVSATILSVQFFRTVHQEAAARREKLVEQAMEKAAREESDRREQEIQEGVENILKYNPHLGRTPMGGGDRS